MEEIRCTSCFRSGDEIDWSCNEGSCGEKVDHSDHCHARNASEDCIPYIEDCKEHAEKCVDECHYKCSCQDPEKIRRDNKSVGEMILTYIIPGDLHQLLLTKSIKEGKDVVTYVVELIKKDLKENNE